MGFIAVTVAEEVVEVTVFRGRDEPLVRNEDGRTSSTASVGGDTSAIVVAAIEKDVFKLKFADFKVETHSFQKGLRENQKLDVPTIGELLLLLLLLFVMSVAILEK